MYYWCLLIEDIRESDLENIGIWEDAGDIVGVVHFEDRYGEVYFETHPEYPHIKSDMLDYAERNLSASSEDNKRYLKAFINDFDSEFESIAKSRDYMQDKRSPGYTSQFDIVNSALVVTLPEGFVLKSLADDNDLSKVNRVLHRGFNHPGEAPEEIIALRGKIQIAPNFRKDLTIVVEAPDGNFVSYCGIWYEYVNKIAYVEPVATDPDYRRRGLGKAAVLEAIRRTGELGATVAYVGSGLPFYEAIGFRKIFANYPWIKFFDS
jgi:predicted N-acetyltransferase YhbS